MFLQSPVTDVHADLDFHSVGFAKVCLKVVAKVEGFEELGIVAETDGLSEPRLVFLWHPSVLTEEVGAEGHGEREVLVIYLMVGSDAKDVLAVVVVFCDSNLPFNEWGTP